MMDKTVHVSDDKLLPFLDGELSPRSARKVQAHLEACWNCRARAADMQLAIRAFVHSRDCQSDEALPAADGPRSLLRAHLAEQAKTPFASPRRLIPSFHTPVRLAAASIVLISMTVGGALFIHQTRMREANAGLSTFERSALPEHKFTPGATRIVAIDDVCTMAQEEVVKEVPEPIRVEVLKEYGIENASAGEFEIDYLIAPGLGGIEDIKNLWPEPYTAPTWNAHVKDALEQRLHQMVCSGNLDLPTAQREIAVNWIAAYKKYFHTETPLAQASRLHRTVKLDNSRT